MKIYVVMHGKTPLAAYEEEIRAKLKSNELSTAITLQGYSNKTHVEECTLHLVEDGV